MKKIGIIIIIIILAVGGTVLIKETYFAPRSEISKEPVKDDPGQPETELKKTEITLYSEDETTRWELSAQSIQQFEGSTQVLLEDVKASIYKQEVEVVTLRAAGGEVDTRTSFLTLKGPLTIKSGQKVVKADKLNWNQAKDELIGRGNVVIKRPGVTVTGDSFIARVDLKKLRVKGKAKAIYSKAGEEDEE